MEILLSLLQNQKVQAVLIAAAANAVATLINKVGSKGLSDKLQLWIHPLYMILAALVSGLGSLETGSLHVDAATVQNFLTIWVTTVVTHLTGKEIAAAHAAVKSSQASTQVK